MGLVWLKFAVAPLQFYLKFRCFEKATSVPNRGAGTFINFDEKFPDFPVARPLFYSILVMPARLFGPALLFGYKNLAHLPLFI
jgi:hypothetical protein